MTAVIPRPVAAWSDLSHSEIGWDGGADLSTPRSVEQQGAHIGLQNRIAQRLVWISIAMQFSRPAISASGRVTGTVGEVGSVAGQVGVGARSAGSSRLPATGSGNPPNSSLLGGELPGGVKMKLGDKVINLRGDQPSRQCRGRRQWRQFQSRRRLAVLKRVSLPFFAHRFLPILHAVWLRRRWRPQRRSLRKSRQPQSSA